MEDVLILGAGRVGGEIARALVGDGYDITIVDTDTNRLLALQSSYDLRTVRGNAADEQLLREADVSKASVVVAVTASDEVNLVASKVCSSITGNSIRTIARVRNPQYSSELVREEFGINASFCPEELVAGSFGNAIAHPGCLSVHRFSDGSLALAGIRISSKADVAGATIEDFRHQISEIDYRIVSIYRDGNYLIPQKDTRLFVGDDVYVVAEDANLNELTPFLAGPQPENKRIFIAGGGSIGGRLARLFEDEQDVKVLEKIRERCRVLSQSLSKALILKGEATDETLLQQENISDTDIFCAVTSDDEENILSALLAKRLGAKRVAVLINRTAYVEILERQLDIVLSPSQITIGSVLSTLRAGNFNAVHSLRYGSAEAVEFTVRGDHKNSNFTDREVEQVKWPNGVSAGAIVRGSGKERKLIITHDNTLIEENDHLICFASDRTAMREMRKLIGVGLGYTGDVPAD